MKSIALASLIIMAGTGSAYSQPLLMAAEDFIVQESLFSEIQKRGNVRCGISGDLIGMSQIRDRVPQGEPRYSGLDVNYCRAFAISVFGLDKMLMKEFPIVARGKNEKDNVKTRIVELLKDVDKTAVMIDKFISYIPTKTNNRFAYLARGDVDILARNTTVTSTRNNMFYVSGPPHHMNVIFGFTSPVYYDAQVILIDIKKLARRGNTSQQKIFKLYESISDSDPADIDSIIHDIIYHARICVQEDTTNYHNLYTYLFDMYDGIMKTSVGDDRIVQVDSAPEAIEFLEQDQCDAYSADQTTIRGATADWSEENPDIHKFILNGDNGQELSKEPLSLVFREHIVYRDGSNILRMKSDPVTAHVLNWMVEGMKHTEEIGFNRIEAIDIYAGILDVRLETNAIFSDKHGFSVSTNSAVLPFKNETRLRLREIGADELGRSAFGFLPVNKTWLLEIVAALGNYGEIYIREVLSPTRAYLTPVVSESGSGIPTEGRGRNAPPSTDSKLNYSYPLSYQ